MLDLGLLNDAEATCRPSDVSIGITLAWSMHLSFSAKRTSVLPIFLARKSHIHIAAPMYMKPV